MLILGVKYKFEPQIMHPLLIFYFLLFLALSPLISLGQQQPGPISTLSIDSVRTHINITGNAMKDPSGLFSVAFTPTALADYLTIEVEEKSNKSRFSVQLLSLTGDDMHSYNELGPEKAELDLSRLSAGIYLVYVENKQGDRVFYKLLKR